MYQFIIFFLLFLFVNVNISVSEDNLILTRAEKQIVLTGFTRSETTMVLSPEVSGKVIAVNYDIGEIIGKNPFVSVDPTFIDFQIKQTRQSIREIMIAEKKIDQNIRYLKKEFERIDFLHKGDRATEVKRDAAENSLIQARLEHDELSSKRQMLEITLKELAEKKHRHHIQAPKGWVVVERQVEKGEIISPDVPLGRISNYKNLVVPLAVSGDEFDAIERLPKKFKVSVNGKSVLASLNWVNPEFNEKSRKLNIEIILLDYNYRKRGGLPFSLPLKITTDGLLISKKAITNRYDNPRITLKSSKETINVEILGESGNNVIIANDIRLKPGMALLPSH